MSTTEETYEELHARVEANALAAERRCRVVAFMQNQWFKNPERVRDYMEGRLRTVWIRRFLFMGCRSGQRLQAAFGEDACDNLILWEEASREIGGHSSSVFPPDPEHMRAVLLEYRPAVVLAFGKVAQTGLLQATGLWGEGDIYAGDLGEEAGDGPIWHARVIHAPHPTARHATVREELADAARRMRALLSLTA